MVIAKGKLTLVIIKFIIIYISQIDIMMMLLLLSQEQQVQISKTD